MEMVLKATTEANPNPKISAPKTPKPMQIIRLLPPKTQVDYFVILSSIASNAVTPPLKTFRALACWFCHRVRAMSIAAPSFEATTNV